MRTGVGIATKEPNQLKELAAGSKAKAKAVPKAKAKAVPKAKAKAMPRAKGTAKRRHHGDGRARPGSRACLSWRMRRLCSGALGLLRRKKECK